MHKFRDRAATSLMVAWLSFGVGGSAMNIWQRVEQEGASIQNFSDGSNVIFMCTIIGLYLIRQSITRSLGGYLPTLVGAISIFWPVVILGFPRAELSPLMAFLSATISIFGTLASVYVVCWLGRAFSILPQARVLVVDGPYKIVRHPLYLMEFIAAFGVSLQFSFPWSMFLLLLMAATQWPRMYFEEKVLLLEFPSYYGYIKRTKRLIPYIY